MNFMGHIDFQNRIYVPDTTKLYWTQLTLQKLHFAHTNVIIIFWWFSLDCVRCLLRFSQLWIYYFSPICGRLLYFDDILVYSKSLEGHISHLDILFQCLMTNQFFLKRNKCLFFKESIKYLRHNIQGWPWLRS